MLEFYILDKSSRSNNVDFIGLTKEKIVIFDEELFFFSEDERFCTTARKGLGTYVETVDKIYCTLEVPSYYG